MIDKKNITGLILAGGKSTRMGTDKGMLVFHGKTFIQHSINALRPLVSEIIIISNTTAHDIYGVLRIEDVIQNAGPLAGIYSGLVHSKTDYNLVLSCDIPFIKPKILKILLNQVETEDEIVQIMSNGKKNPLIALYKKQCKDLFKNLLQQRERRLQYAVSQCKVKTIALDFEYDLHTTNINTIEEFKLAKNATKN